MNFITAKAEGKRNRQLKDKYTQRRDLEIAPSKSSLQGGQGKWDNCETGTLAVKGVEVKSCQSRTDN